MAIYNDYIRFALDTIEENLIVIEHCLSTRKNKEVDNCYGMSAVILMSSVIDTIGTFYRNNNTYKPITQEDLDNNSLGRGKKHFKVYWERFLEGRCEKDDFMIFFYENIRCKSVHNGIINRDTFISKSNKQDSKILVIENKTAIIFLRELFNVIKKSYETLKQDSAVKMPVLNDPSAGFSPAIKNVEAEH